VIIGATCTSPGHKNNIGKVTHTQVVPGIAKEINNGSILGIITKPSTYLLVQLVQEQTNNQMIKNRQYEIDTSTLNPAHDNRLRSQG
jgi:hypothetical protein